MKKPLLPWLGHLPFLAPVLMLSLFGVAMIYSAGVLNIPSPVTQGLWLRQSVVLAGSIVILFVVSRVPVRWFDWTAMPVYVLTVGVLAATLVVGTGAGTAEGVRSFLSIPGFRFQPAEAAKLATVLVVAKLLAGRESPPQYLRDLLVPGVLVGLPLGLVVLQPDIGTAMAFVGIFFAMIFWARTPWPLIVFAASPALALILSFNTIAWSIGFILLLLGLYLYRYRLYLVESMSVVVANLAAGAVAQPLWNSLPDYQKNRLLVFLDPEMDPRGAGWQLIQSKVAVGSGGILGKGFTEGTQKRLNFLPEQPYRFRLQRRGRGTRIRGHVADAAALRLPLLQDDSDGGRVPEPLCRALRVRYHRDLADARDGQYRHDRRRRSHYRNPASVHQLRGILPPDVVAGHRDRGGDGQ